MTAAIGYAFAAAAGYGCLLNALRHRADRRRHATWAAAGVALDLATVLAVELKRGAVEAVFAGGLPAVLVVHVVASAAALLSYFPLAASGLAALRRERPVPAWHRKLGWSAFAARTIGFVTMLGFARLALPCTFIAAGLPVALLALGGRLHEPRTIGGRSRPGGRSEEGPHNRSSEGGSNRQPRTAAGEILVPSRRSRAAADTAGKVGAR